MTDPRANTEIPRNGMPGPQPMPQPTRTEVPTIEAHINLPFLGVLTHGNQIHNLSLTQARQMHSTLGATLAQLDAPAQEVEPEPVKHSGDPEGIGPEPGLGDRAH